jgi:hypothetical protein
MALRIGGGAEESAIFFLAQFGAAAEMGGGKLDLAGYDHGRFMDAASLPRGTI